MYTQSSSENEQSNSHETSNDHKTTSLTTSKGEIIDQRLKEQKNSCGKPRRHKNTDSCKSDEAPHQEKIQPKQYPSKNLEASYQKQDSPQITQISNSSSPQDVMIQKIDETDISFRSLPIYSPGLPCAPILDTPLFPIIPLSPPSVNSFTYNLSGLHHPPSDVYLDHVIEGYSSVNWLPLTLGATRDKKESRRIVNDVRS